MKVLVISVSYMANETKQFTVDSQLQQTHHLQQTRTKLSTTES